MNRNYVFLESRQFNGAETSVEDFRLLTGYTCLVQNSHHEPACPGSAHGMKNVANPAESTPSPANRSSFPQTKQEPMLLHRTPKVNALQH